MDAKYQWDPSATAGAAGGTVRPHFRRVTAYDMNWLELAKMLKFDTRNKAVLGEATNLILGSQFSKQTGGLKFPWVY